MIKARLDYQERNQRSDRQRCCSRAIPTGGVRQDGAERPSEAEELNIGTIASGRMSSFCRRLRTHRAEAGHYGNDWCDRTLGAEAAQRLEQPDGQHEERRAEYDGSQ